MVLHSWEFWKPVSSAMVRHLNKAGNKASQKNQTINRLNKAKLLHAVALPVPGLACNAGQDEPQAETNKGVDNAYNPQGGSNVPGGLVENSSNHSNDDNESKAGDGAHLFTADTCTFNEMTLCKG